MTTFSEPPTPAAARPFRFSLRSALLFVTLVGVLSGGFVALERYLSSRRRHSDQIEAMLDGLVMRRPKNVSRGSWNVAVGWTLNLHGNSLVPFQASDAEIRAFRDALRNRLTADQVNVDTINWIWDEYAELTPAGRHYQRFRDVMKSQMDNVAPNHQVWAGVHVP